MFISGKLKQMTSLKVSTPIVDVSTALMLYLDEMKTREFFHDEVELHLEPGDKLTIWGETLTVKEEIGFSALFSGIETDVTIDLYQQYIDFVSSYLVLKKTQLEKLADLHTLRMINEFETKVRFGKAFSSYRGIQNLIETYLPDGEINLFALGEARKKKKNLPLLEILSCTVRDTQLTPRTK